MVAAEEGRMRGQSSVGTRASIWRPAAVWFRPTAVRVLWTLVCAALLVVLWFNPMGQTTEGLLLPLSGLAVLTAPLGPLALYTMGQLEVGLGGDAVTTGPLSAGLQILQNAHRRPAGLLAVVRPPSRVGRAAAQGAPAMTGAGGLTGPAWRALASARCGRRCGRGARRTAPAACGWRWWRARRR